VPIYDDRFARVNGVLLRAQVAVACRLAGIARPACFVTLPTAAHAVTGRRLTRVVFNRSDNFGALPGEDATRLIARTTSFCAARVGHVEPGWADQGVAHFLPNGTTVRARDHSPTSRARAPNVDFALAPAAPLPFALREQVVQPVGYVHVMLTNATQPRALHEPLGIRDTGMVVYAPAGEGAAAEPEEGAPATAAEEAKGSAKKARRGSSARQRAH
jgi:hypothetical protein